MPSASYLRNNDYSVEQFKPYELPYNATLNEIATKTAYWQQGAARIKQTLDATLGLDPQYSQNKEYLKDFVDKANVQLTKAAKSDLSQQDNVGAAIGIFKPLYDTSNPFNANLLIDSQTNDFYKKQSQLADASRTTNGGKNWSKSNQFYMDSGYAKYLKDAKDGNTNTIQDNWQNKKGFIPYYDYSDDLKQAIKNCHQDGAETTSVNANSFLYFQTTGGTGISADKMQNCVQFLPPQAKQQIGIDSYQHYYGNPEGLLNDYKNLVYQNSKDRADAILGKITAAKLTKDTKTIDKLTPLYEEANNSYQEGLKQYNQMIGTDGIGFINRNYEQIASQVGFNHFTKRAGDTFSWKEVKNKLSPNASGIAEFNAQKEAAMLKSKQNADYFMAGLHHQYKMEEIDQEGKYKGTGKKSSPTNSILPDGTSTDGITRIDQAVDPTSTDSDNSEQKSLNIVHDKFQNLSDQMNTVTNMISPLIANDSEVSRYMQRSGYTKDGKLTPTMLINFIDQYDKSDAIKDPNLTIALRTLKQSYQDYYDANNSFNATKKKQDDIVNKSFDNTKPIDIHINDENGKPITLTEADIVKLNGGQNIKGLQIRKESGFNGLLSVIGQTPVVDNSEILTYTDKNNNTKDLQKIVNEPNSPELGLGLNNNFSGIISNIRRKAGEVNKKRNLAFANNLLSSKGIFNIGESGTDLKERNEQLATQLNLSGNDDFTVNSTYRKDNGDAYVRIVSKGKGQDSNSNLTESEYNKIQASVPNLKIKEEKIGGIPYVVVPGVYSALPNYLSTKEIEAVKNFTLVNMPDKSGVTSTQKRQITNDNNIDVRYSVTNMNGSPFYNVEIYNNGQWIKNPVSLKSENELLTYINNISKK